MNSLKDFTSQASHTDTLPMLSAALDAMSAHVAILDPDGKIIAVNAAWSSYAEENMLAQAECGIGQYYVEVCKPATHSRDPDATVVTEAIDRILCGDSSEAFHHDYLCPHPGDPTRDRWFHLTLQPFELDHRTHILMSHEDIAERHTSHRSRELLERAVEQVSAGVIITDPAGRIIYANGGFSRITGYPIDEVLGQSPRFLKSGRIPPETYAEMWSAITSGRTWRGTICNRRKNGKLYWERQVISPMLDSAGILTHIVSVKEDITDTHHKNLMHSGVINSSADAFVSLDINGMIKDWSLNAEALFDIPEDEALGKSFAKLVLTSKLEPEFSKQLKAYAATGKTSFFIRSRRFTAQNIHGFTFPAEINLVPVDLDGEWLFTGFVHDLTESIHNEQQIIQAQKLEAIGQLAGGMAHDFNNIIGIISGSLDLLRGQLTNENKYLEIASEATKRAAEVTKSLMSVARRRSLNPIECDANDLLRALEPLLIQTAGKSINLKFAIEGPAPPVKIEPTGFNNAIINLTVNAKDAMPRGGSILIYTYPIVVAEELGPLGLNLPQGPYLVVGVDDTGSGMSAEIAAKAFEPFFTTKEPGKGTGLGLAMVYGFARQSNGLARITNSPGCGCSIQMLLPIAHSFSVDLSQPPSSRNCYRILFVDGDPDLLLIGRNYLTAQGHTVYTAISPAKALGLLASDSFDLMITDVSMPGGMDGVELAKQAHDLSPQTRIMFATGSQIEVPGVIGNQAVQVLRKPIALDRLSASIKSLFQQ